MPLPVECPINGYVVLFVFVSSSFRFDNNLAFCMFLIVGFPFEYGPRSGIWGGWAELPS